MRVAIQPASLARSEVRQHYADTIANPVVFSHHADFLDPAVQARLNLLFPDGSAPMWGVIPGKNGTNVSKVDRLQPGDFVLFYGEGRCYLAGTIAMRWHNRPLAQRLWTDNRENPPQTWEHMYAVADLRTINVPIEELRSVLGWQNDAYPMGFNVYEGEKANHLGELCNLDPGDLPLPILQPLEDAQDTTSDVSDDLYDNADDGPLERMVTSMLRQEQQRLKRRLIELGSNSCALCGLQLPPEFLVAAHIKRRSECTDQEKRDFDGVAMLACLLGCDSLFEHGYVAVQTDGRIELSPWVHGAPAVHQHVATRLSDRTTTWWTEKREPYFAWHRTHTFKTSPERRAGR